MDGAAGARPPRAHPVSNCACPGILLSQPSHDCDTRLLQVAHICMCMYVRARKWHDTERGKLTYLLLAVSPPRSLAPLFPSLPTPPPSPCFPGF